VSSIYFFFSLSISTWRFDYRLSNKPCWSFRARSLSLVSTVLKYSSSFKYFCSSLCICVSYSPFYSSNAASASFDLVSDSCCNLSSSCSKACFWASLSVNFSKLSSFCWLSVRSFANSFSSDAYCSFFSSKLSFSYCCNSFCSFSIFFSRISLTRFCRQMTNLVCLTWRL